MSLYTFPRQQVLRAVRLTLIGYYENKSVYERTKLGLLWVPLSTFAFVLILTFVFSTKEGTEAKHFFLYVMVGYTLWMFILETISQSTMIIQSQIDFANHNRMDLADLFLKNLIDRFFRHLLNVGLLFLCAAILSIQTVGYSLFAYGPLLIILLATSFGLSYLINFLTLIFPDAEKMIQTGARFLFFLSPIFWTVNSGTGGIRNILVTYNPVSYYLSIGRQVFFVEPFAIADWLISMAITSVICIASYICFIYTKNLVRNIN